MKSKKGEEKNKKRHVAMRRELILCTATYISQGTPPKGGRVGFAFYQRIMSTFGF